MKQIQVRPSHRSAVRRRQRDEYLPLDPRDPDILRAKTSRSRPQSGSGQPADAAP
jgi:hypothetical protein